MYIRTTTPKFIAKFLGGVVLFVPMSLLFVVSLGIAALICTPIYLILIASGALLDDDPIQWVLDWWDTAYSLWKDF